MIYSKKDIKRGELKTKVKDQTKENQKEIQNKLNMLHLNINSIPSIFEIQQKVKYKPLKEYDNTNYKVYRFVDIKEIQIYLTNTTRLEEAEHKYQLAEPLMYYLQPKNEELLENYEQFLNMLKELDVSKIEEIEKQQKAFQKQIPYEVKYKNNFIWEIYYSEIDHQYFMLFPMKEAQTEALFYLIKKQIELQKTKKTEYIYVPINNIEYTNNMLKKSEIADLENYLWYFTQSWPFTYEVQQKDGSKSIQLVGKIPVYEKVKSIYKLQFNTKEEAQKQFKLIKALFIIQSHAEEEYSFCVGVNQHGGLSFYYNHHEITYENLADLIKTEVEKKQETLQKITEQNALQKEKWELLKQTIEKQNIEYLAKEKQIATFLEYKKTFFGKVSYFFKFKKKKKQEEKPVIEKEKGKEKEVKVEKIEIEKKDFYTVEDLLKVCQLFSNQEQDAKNKQMDIKALENKKENLERKIQNATLYINEIEQHKKSIFDFWKFTKKDEVNLLAEGEKQEEVSKNHKIRKVFSFEEDMEEVGKKIDRSQRELFEKKECDAIFAIYQDVEAFNIERKEKKLKKEENYLENSLKQKQEAYQKDFDIMQAKDFDIFGSVVEDKTKIKVLNNQKHREIQKDAYQVLDIHLNTTLEEYQDNLHHYQTILEKSYSKMKSPYDISVYQISTKPIEENKWAILDINPKKVIEKWNKKEDTIILNRINIKENMPVLFYSNIMFYGNDNQTLPEGMDISTEVLIDLKQYEIKLIGRKDFNMNFMKNELEQQVKAIEVYEYDIQKKESV